MFMLRRGPWKYIYCPTDPEQLFKEDENAAEWTAAVVAV